MTRETGLTMYSHKINLRNCSIALIAILSTTGNCRHLDELKVDRQIDIKDVAFNALEIGSKFTLADIFDVYRLKTDTATAREHIDADTGSSRLLTDTIISPLKTATKHEMTMGNLNYKVVSTPRNIAKQAAYQRMIRRKRATADKKIDPKGSFIETNSKE